MKKSTSNTEPCGVLLTPRELAARWKWHAESVRRKIRRGEIDSVVLGGRRLIPLAVVEQLEQAATVKAKII
jgi:excisionase family DNA binding protein